MSSTDKVPGAAPFIEQAPSGDFRLYDFLRETRMTSASFSDGMNKVEALVLEYAGLVVKEVVDGQLFYHITVNADTATCFQPYSDIDRFYFEM